MAFFFGFFWLPSFFNVYIANWQITIFFLVNCFYGPWLPVRYVTNYQGDPEANSHYIPYKSPINYQGVLEKPFQLRRYDQHRFFRSHLAVTPAPGSWRRMVGRCRTSSRYHRALNGMGFMGICIYTYIYMINIYIYTIISPLCLVTLITILLGNKSVVWNYIIHCWLIKMIPKSPWLSSETPAPPWWM